MTFLETDNSAARMGHVTWDTQNDWRNRHKNQWGKMTGTGLLWISAIHSSESSSVTQCGWEEAQSQETAGSPGWIWAIGPRIPAAGASSGWTDISYLWGQRAWKGCVAPYSRRLQPSVSPPNRQRSLGRQCCVRLVYWPQQIPPFTAPPTSLPGERRMVQMTSPGPRTQWKVKILGWGEDSSQHYVPTMLAWNSLFSYWTNP